MKIGFVEGQDVKAGQPLFTIDQSPYKAAVEQAEADRDLSSAALVQSEAALLQSRAQVEEAKADLAQNQTRQKLNITEFDRAKSLKGVIAQTDYDAKEMAVSAGEAQIRSNQAAINRAEAQTKQSSAAIEMAKAKIKSGDSAISMAKINLRYTEITSPIDGRAGQRMVDVGNVVTANMGNAPSTTMLTIQAMSPIYAEFSVPERELAHIRSSLAAKTLKVECTNPEKPDAPHGGEVFFIDNAVQEGTGTIRLRARIPNDDRFFWPGEFVKVRLIFEIKKDAVLVPSFAPQISQTSSFVFVVKPDSTAEMRNVKLGPAVWRPGRD